MSDPRQSKVALEIKQGYALLRGIGLSPVDIDKGPDPPDLIAKFTDRPLLNIEVTAYHPGKDRVGMEQRWRELRILIDTEVQRRPHLRGVFIIVHCQNDLVPGKRHHKRIADDLVRCIEHIATHGWVDDALQGVLFRTGILDPAFTKWNGWVFLPAEDWPFLSAHVKHIDLSREPFPYHYPVQCFPAQSACCSPFAEAFMAIVKKKEARIKAAIESGKCKDAPVPLWLLILTNSPRDMEAHIFSDPLLPLVAEKCRDAFAASCFDEIWLMEHDEPHRVQSLHPWKVFDSGKEGARRE